jgi:hypothetical protein
MGVVPVLELLRRLLELGVTEELLGLLLELGATEELLGRELELGAAIEELLEEVPPCTEDELEVGDVLQLAIVREPERVGAVQSI